MIEPDVEMEGGGRREIVKYLTNKVRIHNNVNYLTCSFSSDLELTELTSVLDNC